MTSRKTRSHALAIRTRFWLKIDLRLVALWGFDAHRRELGHPLLTSKVCHRRARVCAH
ncbi:MAG: hypothetical protein LC791_08510 [Acidobacteria bacterium]|nr:hypothetical protein [Acidobacteriota bacterium]